MHHHGRVLEKGSGLVGEILGQLQQLSHSLSLLLKVIRNVGERLMVMLGVFSHMLVNLTRYCGTCASRGSS